MTLNLDRERDGGQVPSPPTERVIAVMDLLNGEPGRVFPLAEISRQLGISRATAHAILATLVRHAWATRHGTGYAVGPAFGDGGEFRGLLRRLSEEIGAQAFLARRDGASIVVTESVGESAVGAVITEGLRIPLVAPFGRDYVAWAGDRAIADWLGDPAPALRRRLTAVLAAVRERGYVVERLSREYVRVYTALHALAADGEPDAITTRLASAFADLTVVDVLPDEVAALQIATISAPIRDARGAVLGSLTVAPFRRLRAREVASIGATVCDAAGRIEVATICTRD